MLLVLRSIFSLYNLAVDSAFDFVACAAFLLDVVVELSGAAYVPSVRERWAQTESDTISHFVPGRFADLGFDPNLVPALLNVARFKNAHINNAIFRFACLLLVTAFSDHRIKCLNGKMRGILSV